MENHSPYPPRWCDRPRHKTHKSEAAQPKRETPPRKKPTPQASRARQEADKRRVRKHTLAVLYSLLAVEFIAALFTSPVFAVKQVMVSGTESLTAVERTEVERAVTLAPRTNFLTVGIGKIQKQIAGQMEVKQAVVSRRLPNILAVKVTPRIPFASVSMKLNDVESIHCEVDAQGFPIRLTAQPTPKLPHLVLQRNLTIAAGKSLNDVALNQTLALLKEAETGLVSRIEKILIDPQGNLCLNMRDGVAIQFGQAENLGAKWETVQRIYTREPAIAQRMTGINLSVPEKPACTPRITLPEGIDPETVPSI